MSNSSEVEKGPASEAPPQRSILQTLPPKTLRPPINDFADDDGAAGPSWGLIIPIIMIGVFLLGVVLCLWWHKWRNKRTLSIPREDITGTSFQRSYRGNRSGFDAIRDSTRSTLPLRNSLNEKIMTTNNNNIVKVKNVSNVNVIPVQRSGSGKYSFYWDKTHWKAYTTPTLSGSGRMGQKPLSPINEIDSPNSAKLSELSMKYDVKAQPSFSPYHLTWSTSSNAPPSYEQSEKASFRFPPPARRSSGEYSVNPLNGYEPVVNSPFYPNNNTPTTECDTDSEASQNRYNGHGSIIPSSQCSSYPSSQASTTILSAFNSHLCHSNETDRNGTSYETSFPDTSYRTSQSHSGFQVLPSSGQTSATDQPSTNLSSLPSSIAQFSKQNVLLVDPNNNSMLVPNAYMSFPLSRAMNYTLASSVTSSETQFSDNTSMLPNIGSNNTSEYPATATLSTHPQSTEQSGRVSPEDLSKLVDEMSSIRPVDESSSLRPNSSVDPASRLVSISGNSMSADMQRSWSVVADMEYVSLSSMDNSCQPTSQNDLSLYWDNYPLSGNQHVSKSYPDLPRIVPGCSQSFVGNVQPTSHVHYRAPILMETQYWV